jgi:hypothetical protein
MATAPTREYWKYEHSIQRQTVRTEIGLSKSVVAALNNLPHTEVESGTFAIEIIWEIVNIDEDFADYEARRLLDMLIPTSKETRSSKNEVGQDSPWKFELGQKKDFKEWIKETMAIYDKDRVTMIDGRKLIIGLCLADYDTGKRLRSNDFFEKIQNENIYPKLLTTRGRKLWHRLFSMYRDSVLTHKDAPTKQDKLGRKSFAKFLVDLLYQVKDEDQLKNDQINEDPDAFILHIDGAWGSGKSSLEFYP